MTLLDQPADLKQEPNRRRIVPVSMRFQGIGQQCVYLVALLLAATFVHVRAEGELAVGQRAFGVDDPPAGIGVLNTADRLLQGDGATVPPLIDPLAPAAIDVPGNPSPEHEAGAESSRRPAAPVDAPIVFYEEIPNSHPKDQSSTSWFYNGIVCGLLVGIFATVLANTLLNALEYRLWKARLVVVMELLVVTAQLLQELAQSLPSNLPPPPVDDNPSDGGDDR